MRQRGPLGTPLKINGHPMNILIEILTELLKAALPELLDFTWDKNHEPTTIEDAAVDNDLRQRLLARIRLRSGASGDSTNHPTPPTGGAG